MPRKSADAIAGEIWRARNAPPPPPHPEPPAWFSEAAARHWREIVRSRPPDYFDAANRLFLEMLCCHIVSADRIWAQIHECDPTDPKQFRRYRSLLVMASRESRMTSLLLTKLRLLPSKAAAAAAEVTPVRPPWERHVWKAVSGS
jgi:hypothetical protein